MCVCVCGFIVRFLSFVFALLHCLLPSFRRIKIDISSYFNMWLPNHSSFSIAKYLCDITMVCPTCMYSTPPTEVSNTGGVYTNFAIFCEISFLPMNNYLPVNFMLTAVAASACSIRRNEGCHKMFSLHRKLSPLKNYPTLEFMLPAATAATGVPYASSRVTNSPLENLMLLLCVRCLRAICLR